MIQHQSKKQTTASGFLLVLVLVFASIFLVIISSFVGFVITQNQVVNFRYEQQRATDIAEAGLNYYKWFLSHYPDDVTDGTGLPGPYVHQFKDPEGTFIGEFSLEINSSAYCGSVASIDITSTGHTYEDPSATSIVSARYVRPTVAEYSFITNAGVWYGSGGSVIGPLHSNQGIRMDSAHNSFIGSGQTSWTCDSSYGCGTSMTVDGVYTTSGNATPGLFSFPVTPVDFVGLTLDLNDIKDKSQNNGGLYYGPSGGYGYLVTFNGDGTVTIREVTGTQSYWSYSPSEGWHTSERNVITSSSLVATETIDSSCPLIYIEDKVWLEGEVTQKVSLAAADLSSAGQTNIVINDDITYAPGTSAGILAIAEDDVDIGLIIPGEDLDLDGIYIAQNGRFGRNHYSTSYLVSSLDPYVLVGDLNEFGTVVTNNRAATTWVNNSGNAVSGFTGGSSSFDRDQVNNPPPLAPQTSDVYKFMDWRQE
ncbi:MAG: hypothetical protein ACI9BF_000570 [Candidatus Paceibacteria bacterium]|jgi:hypothetical protein